MTLFVFCVIARARVDSWRASSLRSDVRPDGERGLECARSGAAPAEGCGRVRGTAGAGTTRGVDRGRENDAGGIFIRHPSRGFRPVFVVSASRVRGWMPAGEARNPGKGWVATPRRREWREGARGVDLIEWEDGMRRRWITRT